MVEHIEDNMMVFEHKLVVLLLQLLWALLELMELDYLLLHYLKGALFHLQILN